MSAESFPPRPSPSPRHAVRVEYLDFHDGDAFREFRFHVYGPEGSRELRMRITNAAFDARQVRRQDAPDLCYQKLVRAIAAGVTEHADVSTIDDADLLKYRDDHTVAPKRRTHTPPSLAAAAARAARQAWHRPSAPRTSSREIPDAPVVSDDVEPALQEGQRVRHAVFGLGVTTAATDARTVVSFDGHGSRSFVTSMVELEVLSAPHTWNTGPRGVNRPCPPFASGSGSPS